MNDVYRTESEDFIPSDTAAARLSLSRASFIGLFHRVLRGLIRDGNLPTRGKQMTVHEGDFERWRQSEGLVSKPQGYYLLTELREIVGVSLTPSRMRTLVRRRANGVRRVAVSPGRYAYNLHDVRSALGQPAGQPAE